MSDDRLMQELAKVARAERAAGDGEPGPDPRLAKLSAPLSFDELDALAERTAPLATSPDAVSRPRLARRGARVALFGAPLALAAAIALLVSRGPVASAPGVPGYELVVEGAGQGTRAVSPTPDGEPITVDRGGHLTLLLRPRTPAVRGVGARAMIEHAGELRAWSVPSQISSEGVVRIDATPATLAELPAGTSTLVLFVGATSSLPVDPESAKRALGGPPSGVQSITRTILVAP